MLNTYLTSVTDSERFPREVLTALISSLCRLHQNERPYLSLSAVGRTYALRYMLKVMSRARLLEGVLRDC